MNKKKLLTFLLLGVANILTKNNAATQTLVTEGINMITSSQLSTISLRAGKIISVEDFPKARNPSYKVGINLGDLGIKYSLAQLPFNYPDKRTLLETPKFVLCVTNLGERKIAGFKSQVLITGFPDKNHHVQLVNFRGLVISPGQALCETNPSISDDIDYRLFENAYIAACRVLSAEPTNESETAFILALDAGAEFGERVAQIINTTKELVLPFIGKQIAACINLINDGNSEETDRWNARILTFITPLNDIELTSPLGIDSPVENGSKLF